MATKKEFIDGKLKLGGEGKVVEIDEMYVCHRKYIKGRPVEKEGTWVVGLTKVDATSHPIENPQVQERLKKRGCKRMQSSRACGGAKPSERSKTSQTAKCHADFNSTTATHSR